MPKSVGGSDLKIEESQNVGIGGIDLKSESRDEGRTKKMKRGGGVKPSEERKKMKGMRG